jgi:hypothetical protein
MLAVTDLVVSYIDIRRAGIFPRQAHLELHPQQAIAASCLSNVVFW